MQGVYEYCYRDDIAKTIKLLNQINLTPLFSYDITPYELMQRIEDHIALTPELREQLDNDYFKGDPFNQMDDYDLMEYVEANYGVRFQEISEYRLR